MTPEHNNQRINTPEGFSTGVSLKEILMKYLQFWWLFLLVAALCLTIAWLYLRYTTPQYSVSATLLIRNDNMNRGRGGGAGEDMFADIALFQSNTNKQNEIEILRSRTMMERVVRELGLQNMYYAVGNVKKPNIYRESPFQVEILKYYKQDPNFSFDLHYITDNSFKIDEDPKELLFGQTINLSYAQIRVHKRESVYSDLVYKDYIFRHMDEKTAAETFLKGLEVAPANDLSNVLRLTYVTDNPRLGADIVNQLTAEYSEAGIQDKNEINRRIIAFIDDRLDLVETQLDSVESNLQSFKTNRQVIDLEKQSEFYFGNMTDLEQNIRNQEIQLQVVRLLSDYLENPNNRNSLVPSTLGLSDPTLLAQVGRYNELVSNRQRLIETGVTAQNPLLISAEAEVEAARQNMIVNLNNIQGALNNTITSLSRRRAAVQGQISSIPSKERETREKARQQEIKQNLYLYLLQKREESEIAQASTIANSRVIDNALPKLDQVSPIPIRVYGIGLVAGLVLPVIFIYLIDLLNDKVTRRSDITRVTNAPIIAEIGHNEGDNILLFTEQSRTVIAEQIRILRSNLKFLLGPASEKPTIMVTSSFSGEGKSFVSTNLAASLAVSGKRTVILEFDLRKPKIAAGLGVSKDNGLTNYLVGAATLQDLPHKVPQLDDLYVIPCGPVPPNPSEILLNPRINELFTWLKKEFDAIVIDTAPVGLVSDAITLSSFADATLYIVRQRYTYKRQLQYVNELYEGSKLPKLGLVINDVITEGAKGYYGYGAGKYGYGYGYGMGGLDEGYFKKNNSYKRKKSTSKNI